MKTSGIIRSIFSSGEGSISSKRVCGVLGWFICLGILIYCTWMNTEAPEMIETVLWTDAALLGVDSITNIWKKHGKQYYAENNDP